MRQAIDPASLPCHFSQSREISIRCVRCHGTGSGLLDWKYCTNMFPMQTCCVSMEQEYHQWHLFGRHCSLSKRIWHQPHLGYHGRCASDAHTLDAPNAEIEEICHLGGVRYGNDVRLTLPPSCPPIADKRHYHSICIVTAFRIYAIARLDLSDFSYSMVSANIWSTLEPCLGIVNACLPILQPALARTVGLSNFEWTHRSALTISSIKTTASPRSRWHSRINTAGDANPQWPRISIQTKSSATANTWPQWHHKAKSCASANTFPGRGERKVVRFKDVEWGDYFPRRVNTVPMSNFHCPGARSYSEVAAEIREMEDRDGAVSPCTFVEMASRATHDTEESGDPSQYWD